MTKRRMAAALAAAVMITGMWLSAAPAKAQGLVEYALILVLNDVDAGAFGLSASDAATEVRGSAAAALRCDGSVIPANDECAATLTSFQLSVGDTDWTDADVPVDGIIMFTGLELTSVAFPITTTNPGHPDLLLNLDNTFVARDVIGDEDNGSVTGAYSVADVQFVPIGSTALLLIPGLAFLAAVRRTL